MAAPDGCGQMARVGMHPPPPKRWGVRLSFPWKGGGASIACVEEVRPFGVAVSVVCCNDCKSFFTGTVLRAKVDCATIVHREGILHPPIRGVGRFFKAVLLIVLCLIHSNHRPYWAIDVSDPHDGSKEGWPIGHPSPLPVEIRR